MRSSGTPAAALQKLVEDIRSQSWDKAYDSLANKAEFTQTDFVHDLTGAYPNLRTYASLEKFEWRRCTHRQMRRMSAGAALGHGGWAIR